MEKSEAIRLFNEMCERIPRTSFDHLRFLARMRDLNDGRMLFRLFDSRGFADEVNTLKCFTMAGAHTFELTNDEVEQLIFNWENRKPHRPEAGN